MGSILGKSIASSSNQDRQLSIPWKVKLFLSIFPFFVDLSCRRNHTINRTLLNLVDLKSSPNPTTSKDITVDAVTNLWFRLFFPQNHQQQTTTHPIILYFHGGGFICCSASSKPYNDFCPRLAKELSAVVISVNYRLAPEHKFSAQYEDALKVLDFLAENAEDVLRKNADLQRIFLAGDMLKINV